ncbi:Concanavalin A-like lectin/glucanases superfamily protein [Candidatus Fervidibacteria bacterium JGI MDM2 JNZ-1-D12]
MFARSSLIGIVTVVVWVSGLMLQAVGDDKPQTLLKVTTPPQEIVKQFNLSPFYKKFVSANGIPIVGSEKVSDYALLEAAYIVNNMLAGRDDLRKAIIRNKIRVVVMAHTELTTDIPEHSDMKPKDYWDRRARGLGATKIRPATSCGEENLLCFPGDPYFDENILIHEFGHTIHEIALAEVDPTFDARLKEAYEQAMQEGLWQGTYAATNHHEYWAEGVQIWFHANRTLAYEHNFVNTREQLKNYDPRLAALLEEVFRDNNWVWIPPIVRSDLGHLTGFDFSKAPKFEWPKGLEERYAKIQEQRRAEQKTRAQQKQAETVIVTKRPRTWMLKDGRTFEALFVREANGFAILRVNGGRLMPIKLEELSTPDLRYVATIRQISNDFRVWHLDNIDADKTAPTELKETLPKTLVGSFVKIVNFDARFSEAVLLLIRDDFKMRSYPLRIFSKDDQDYARRKEGERKAKLPKKPVVEYEICWDEYAYHPERDKGVFNYEVTPHFIFFYGNDKTGSGRVLFEEPGFMERNKRYFEMLWDFYEGELGVTMPYAKSDRKCKIPVYITGTGLPKHKEGWAFGAKDIVLHPNAMGEGSSVIPHEFSHNMQFHLGGFRNSPYVGWFWECHANWSAHQWHPAYPAALEVYADRAHYELSSTRMNYGSWPFLQFLTEHPFFGHAFCYRIWEENRKNERDESIEDPFQTIMRVAVETGVFKGDGLRDFGDIIGETAAHMVAWDFTHQYFYRRTMLRHQINNRAAGRFRVVLQPVPDRPGWFKPIYSHAPRQFGINIVDLIRDPKVDEVEVRFEGIVDELEGSDWRVTLVAIDENGEPRYSPMLRGSKGAIRMKLKPTERQLALAVAATPTIYKPMEFRPGYNMKRRHLYEVSFKGCYPVRKPPLPSFFDSLDVEGYNHPNGGGFVAKTAKVAPTAYIGPNAKVLGNAVVEGNARIEDFAVVRDSAVVADNAIVSGFAVVRDNARVIENARVRDCATVGGEVTLKGNARVIEYAHVLGRGTISGDVLIKGFGEIHMQPNVELTGCVVAGEDLEVHLAGYKGPRVEYGLIYGYNNAEILQRELRDNRYLYAYWNFAEPRRQLLKDAFADNDGILRGEPKFGKSRNRHYLQFNGKDQYAVVEGHIVDTASITFDLWLWWEGGAKEQFVFAFGGDNGVIAFTPENKFGRAELVLRKGKSSQSIEASRAVPRRKWVRVTITLGNGVGRIFFDGKLVGESKVTVKPEDIRARFGYIGKGLRGGYLNGRLSSFAVFRKAFGSVGEIPLAEEVVKTVKGMKVSG